MDPDDTGLDGFLKGLRKCGLESRIEAGVVIFEVEPFAGVHAGSTVETGVGVDELPGWPAVPPHWVHFPGSIRFPRTNAQRSAVPAWNRHSRQITRWGNAAEPAQAWVAHVRGVLEEAL